jgi:hypothetical protein
MHPTASINVYSYACSSMHSLYAYASGRPPLSPHTSLPTICNCTDMLGRVRNVLLTAWLFLATSQILAIVFPHRTPHYKIHVMWGVTPWRRLDTPPTPQTFSLFEAGQKGCLRLTALFNFGWRLLGTALSGFKLIKDRQNKEKKKARHGRKDGWTCMRLKPKGTPHVDSHTNIVSHTPCMYEWMYTRVQ